MGSTTTLRQTHTVSASIHETFAQGKNSFRPSKAISSPGRNYNEVIEQAHRLM